MNDFFDPLEYETGTSVRSFNIKETSNAPDGYHILLDIDLDSGFELENVTMKLTLEDLEAYETKDIHEGVKYALGFFDR